MKKDDAMKVLGALPVGNYAVDLFYKYEWQHVFDRSTELFESTGFGDVCFLNDWDEGQEDVCIERIIDIDLAMKREPFEVSINDLIKKAGV